MADRVEDFEYLWQDTSGRYVLIQSVKGSQDLRTCGVYDVQTKRGLLVEDDTLSLEINNRLARAGALILEEFPK